MAAVGELKCGDSSLFWKTLTAHSFLKRNRETRSRHLSIEKMFLTTFLRDPVKVLFISWPRWSTLWPYYVALIGCRYIQANIEWRSMFVPGSVKTRPIITAQWSSIRLIF